MAGYTRTDTSNNISEGNVINAADFDTEYDAIQTAFNASFGHTHGGAEGEGKPITVVGPVQDIVVGATSVTPKLNNIVDLGSTDLKFKNIYIDGIAYIDEIQTGAGTINGTVIPNTKTLVDTNTTQTLTNKTVNLANNTVTGTIAEFNTAVSDANLATLAGTETLTGKTIAFADNTLTGVASTSTSQTLTNKTINLANNTVTGTIADFNTAVSDANLATIAGTETLTGKTITGTKETKVAVAASAIDLATANYFSKTISGATTFTISNSPASGTAVSFILDITNGGSAVVTWWSGVKWPFGTPPTLTASGRDVLGFFTHDGGTTWNGFVLGKAMA